MNNKPQLVILAGPNGSGKSSLICDLLNKHLVDSRWALVNPDNIAKDRGVSPVEAARIALEQRNSLLQRRKSFVVESTLSGNSEIKLLNEAKQNGYGVTVHFISLRDKQMSLFRVMHRVAQGGHDVPVEDIKRRFDRSEGNMIKVKNLADKFYLYDNTGERRGLLLMTSNNEVKKVSQSYEGKFSELLNPYRQDASTRLTKSIYKGNVFRVQQLITNKVKPSSKHMTLIKEMKSNDLKVDPKIEEEVTKAYLQNKSKGQKY